MKPLAILCLALVTHLSLFEGTDSRGLDHGNFLQQLRKYEFVTPQLHAHGRWKRDTSTQTNSGDHLGRTLLYLRGFGKDFTLDVALNRILLSGTYLSRYFDENGNEVVEKNEEKDHCYYQGTVQGCQHSVVAISTCQGIDGMIYDGNETYYVHPLPNNTDKHVMYRARDMMQEKKRCGVESASSETFVDQLTAHGKHRTRRSVQSETKFVELVIVNDNSQYVELSKNKASVEHRSRSIANIVDSLYRPLNIRIALTMVEVWTNGDRIVVDENSDKCLDNFMVYRNDVLYKNFKHDNAMLLVHRSFTGSTVGKASVSAMCGRKSGGVVQDHAPSAAATAATLAHEMGHNFGMYHDDDFPDCKCNAADHQGCIMSAVARSTPSKEWSTCSRDSYQKYLDRGLDACLFNTPTKMFGDAVCGNGFKEEGEECDCGTVEECEKYSEGCCNATTCKLLPGSECDTGPCCGNCKIKAKGTLCREKVNECDLPEHCDGTSELCPSNKYVQNGKPCGNNKGYCYNSECPLHDEQCQDLWGPVAKSGPDGCYAFNEQGNARGNCHRQENNVYLKCAPEDKLCGMLHCTNIDEINYPLIGTERSSYAHYYGLTLCKSASVTLAKDVPDPGETIEGTKCGENKLCIDRNCTDIQVFSSGLRQCPNNCSNGNGICNNEAECFCLSCWQGPDCSEWVECINPTVAGGHDTVSSIVTTVTTAIITEVPGHDTVSSIVTTTTANVTEVPGPKDPQTDDGKGSNLAGILVGVFIIIFLIIGAGVAIYYRKKLLQKWREYHQKPHGAKRYKGVSTGSPKQRGARNGGATHWKTDVEAPKPRPNISGPTLNSTTRKNDPDVAITTNPLGSTKFTNGYNKQDQPVSQPPVAFKPTPPKPGKPEAEKVDSTDYPAPKLRNREWPPKNDKKASLNRVSSPPLVGEPVKPFKPVPVRPPRPDSHAGILEKPAVPPPPVKSPQSQWAGEQKKDTSVVGSQPKVPKRPSEERPSSLPLKPSDIKKGGLPAGNNPSLVSQPKVSPRPPTTGSGAKVTKQPLEERPSSLPLKPSDIKKAGLASGNKKPSSFSAADNKPAPGRQTNVLSKPATRTDDKFPKRPSEERPSSLPLKPSDIKKVGLADNNKPSSLSGVINKPASGRQSNVLPKPATRSTGEKFPKRPSEERPSSLPLKPSDIKKAGLADNKKPSSFSAADNKPKKVPLKPPGPVPPRPGSRPT